MTLGHQGIDACNDREEGILILAGGLTAHNLRDRSSFSPDTARDVHKEFDQAIHEAIAIESVSIYDDFVMNYAERSHSSGGSPQAGVICVAQAPRVPGIATERRPLCAIVRCWGSRGGGRGAYAGRLVRTGVVRIWDLNMRATADSDCDRYETSNIHKNV